LYGFAVTRNGDTSVQPFSPFAPIITTPLGYSNYFDGNGDYLDFAANSAFTMGTGDFTIELWFYSLTSYVSGNGYLLDLGSNGTRLQIFNNQINFTPVAGSFIGGTAGSGLAVGVWYHLAAVRLGSTMTLYLNGSSIGTVTNSSNLTDNDCRIAGYGGGTGYEYNGYISNLRIVKGTAVYTSSFTPPTSPLTAISGTSLLTCQSNSFIDNSTNNFTITVNGNVALRTFNPFGNTSITGGNAVYSIGNVGGTLYFDGTGDYLTMPSTTALSFGTLPFTVECWIYNTSSAAANKMILNRWSGSTGDSYQLFLRSNNRICWQVFNQNSADVAALDVPINSWTHIVWTRVSNSGYLYVNGVLRDTATFSNSSNGNGVATVGADQSGTAPFSGYISNLRVIKGVALYTSGFVPPVAPVTPVANTTLLLSGSNSGLIDYTSKNILETVGNTQLSAVVKKFGSSSMYFDGSGDYLSTPSFVINDLNGDFTVEAWIYRNGSGVLHPIFNLGDYQGSSGILFYVTSGNALAIFTNNGLAMSGGTVSATTWTHVALVRSGSGSGNIKLYVNGTSVGTPATNNTTFTGRLLIGADLYGGSITNFMNGYIDDLRITKGIARYTSNFTPPTEAFITF
jgi:hypothetical protein